MMCSFHYCFQMGSVFIIHSVHSVQKYSHYIYIEHYIRPFYIRIKT